MQFEEEVGRRELIGFVQSGFRLCEEARDNEGYVDIAAEVKGCVQLAELEEDVGALALRRRAREVARMRQIVIRAAAGQRSNTVIFFFYLYIDK